MSQEKLPKTIEELSAREEELNDIIDKARIAVENLSEKKMSAIESRIEEDEYFNLDTTKKINSIRRKIQRESNQEKKTETSIQQQKRILNETIQKLTRQEIDIINHLNEQVKTDMIEETDDLLARLDELEGMEEKGEENKKKKRELTKKVSNLVKRVGDVLNNKNEAKQDRIEVDKKPAPQNEENDTSSQEEKMEGGLTTEEESILAEAEENIKDADKKIAEAREKLEKLYAELKLAQFREKKEVKTLAQEKAKNKKLKTTNSQKKIKQKDNIQTDAEGQAVLAEKEETPESISEYESKKAEIERRRQEGLSLTIVDESEVQKMVDRMLGNDEKTEYEKKNQIRYTFEDSLVNGLGNAGITQVIKETGKRDSLTLSMYWLTKMIINSRAIEKGRELGLIDNDKYNSLISKVQKAKSVVEKEVNDYINEINTKYDAELAKLENGANKESGNSTEKENETKKEIPEIKTVMEKNDKVENFSPDFIKGEIISLLKKGKQIDNVKEIEFVGKDDKITIKTEIRAQKGKTSAVFEITFTNKNGKIVVGNSNVEAKNNIETAFIKGVINPYLKNILKSLKDGIEQKINKKVEKIWIENGELKAL
ncbi:MAG: hypothetical protein WC603_01280 [Candidatus Paceibacterota bacterium]|jgi:hypothetical protein